MRRLALLFSIATWVAAVPAPAGAAVPPGKVSYRPPVEAPIVDEFRPPAQRWSAGNRGIDYGTAPGTKVRAAADGEVTFAGQVGGSLHVVLLHSDGVRTSYSFLRTVTVRRGQRVAQGQVLGTTAGPFHFGARVGDTYIDPRTLFDQGLPAVHLVPDEVRRPSSEAEERDALARSVASSNPLRSAFNWLRDRGADAVGAAARAVAAQIRGKLDQLRGLAHYAWENNPAVRAFNVARAIADWWHQRGDCTPSSEPTPGPIPERRVALLVGGLGSSSNDAAVDEVDTAALGYRPGDVVRFSYLGGTTADNPYGPADTTVDLRKSADQLRLLLQDLQAANPGVPVDIIAHSQGGLVARQALAWEYNPNDARFPPVHHLVTLGTPHQGTDLATALAMLGQSTSGQLAQGAFDLAFPNLVDLRGESLAQMSEVSEFIRKLNERSLPAGVEATSIGARADVVVPAPRTELPGGHNVTVSVPDLNDHSALPGSDVAHREIALALAGKPPTCQSLVDMLADAAVAEGISWAEDSLGQALWGAGQAIDAELKAFLPEAPNRTAAKTYKKED